MILCRRYHFELQFKPMWLFQTSIVFLWMSKNSHLSDVFDRFWIIKRFYQGTIIVPWFYLALNSIENNFCKCLWTKLSTNLKYKLSSHKNLSDVPFEHKYFFIKEIHRILKFSNLERSTFEKGFLCRSARFFFILGYICFTKLFSISSKFEDLLRQVWYII